MLVQALRVLKEDFENGKSTNISNIKLDSVSAYLHNLHVNRKEILPEDDYKTVLFFLERKYEKQNSM